MKLKPVPLAKKVISVVSKVLLVIDVI